MLNISRRKLLLHSNQILGTSIYKMASQIPITIKAPAAAASSAAVRGKKRPGSVNLAVVAAPQSTGASSKKKRPTISATAQQQVAWPLFILIINRKPRLFYLFLIFFSGQSTRCNLHGK